MMVPKTALSRPFRAPAKPGLGIMIIFSCVYFLQIVAFRPFATLSPPFRGLWPLQQKKTCKNQKHMPISADITRILKVLLGF